MEYTSEFHQEVVRHEQAGFHEQACGFVGSLTFYFPVLSSGRFAKKESEGHRPEGHDGSRAYRRLADGED
jgi:hypothetical protein